MKLQVRYLEQYTIIRATDPIEFNTEDFEDFVGETEEDFLEYINELRDEDYERVYDLEYGDSEVIYDSRTKFGDEWLDCGVPNENFRKNGNFQTNFSTK